MSADNFSDQLSIIINFLEDTGLPGISEGNDWCQLIDMFRTIIPIDFTLEKIQAAFRSLNIMLLQD